jgi:hypothetical protein
MLMRIVEDTNLPMQQSLLRDYINPDEDLYYKIHVTFIVYNVSDIGPFDFLLHILTTIYSVAG